ncbi:3-ketoacyl-CoA synthase [Rhynchospora pubera]|uniref:3-ketoacyl-CoA synthase n=1 Tax=Rhynchospora pubera TaxID=906938 RepID=A0AAV8FT43_9POAL|nr:3-ketoacyl-CoA synthase [Rhynchospora pubera]
MMHLQLLAIAVISSIIFFLCRRRRLPVLLLDYSCHLPDPERRCTLDLFEYICLRSRLFNPESSSFMTSIFCKSGLSKETYTPPYLFQPPLLLSSKHPLAIQEAEEGLFAAVSSLLNKTDVPPEKISHLIVACSMFSPTPSLTSMLVRRFGFTNSVKTYNLSGMGCSGGTTCIDLATRLLSQNHGYALVAVTESNGINWYFGNDRNMLIPNCIFRVGSAAVLLTSDPTLRDSAKMEILHTLRTHHGTDDSAYKAGYQMEDADGNLGIAISKDLVRVAAVGLKRHVSLLASQVLPLSEIARYAFKVVLSYMMGNRKAIALHVPDFMKAFDHVCIHAGGKAVIEAMGKSLRLGNDVMEPARMTLHRFGNTSSSLVFYELAYLEAKGRVKEGDRIWMLAFGTGFKACTIVLRVLKDSSIDSANPWSHCVSRYPIS